MITPTIKDLDNARKGKKIAKLHKKVMKLTQKIEKAKHGKESD